MNTIYLNPYPLLQSGALSNFHSRFYLIYYPFIKRVSSSYHLESSEHEVTSVEVGKITNTVTSPSPQNPCLAFKPSIKERNNRNFMPTCNKSCLTTRHPSI